MSKSLDGRVAVVTGGTQGIGFAIVEEFAEQGATVVLTGRNQGKRRSFKRGLWGSCVATLMPHKAILLSRRDAAPPASFHLNVAKDRF